MDVRIDCVAGDGFIQLADKYFKSDCPLSWKEDLEPFTHLSHTNAKVSSNGRSTASASDILRAFADALDKHEGEMEEYCDTSRVRELFVALHQTLKRGFDVAACSARCANKS